MVKAMALRTPRWAGRSLCEHHQIRRAFYLATPVYRLYSLEFAPSATQESLNCRRIAALSAILGKAGRFLGGAST